MSARETSIVVETPAEVPVDDSAQNVLAEPSPPPNTELPPAPKPGSGIVTALLINELDDLSVPAVAARVRSEAAIAAELGDELQVHVARARAVDSDSLDELGRLVGGTGLRNLRLRIDEHG
jgi:hypothetical protein